MSKTPRDKRFLFDLNHPADFHFFKNLFSHLEEKGYSFKVLARNKECLHELLEAQGIPFISRGKGSHFLLGKYVYAGYILFLSFIQLVLFRPGLTLSLSSPYLITVSRFLRIPTLVYDDTDFNPRLLPLIKRADYIFTPANYPHTFHKNHFHIHTYKELAYLAPSPPMEEDLSAAVFFRMTRTDSVHHASEARIGGSKLIQEINRISKNHPCFLSSETGKADHLSDKVMFPDRVNIHQDLKGCSAFWGNSATMATEAVILGIPSVFVGSEKFAYLKELEDHGLLFCFQPDELELSFKKLDDLINRPHSKKHFEQAQIQLLKEKINITGLLIWFIEHLPEGALSLRENPEIQFRFRRSKS
jgi:predicted glycosyltransferase